jgi:transcriptional regulator GlxA family with amidase domain
MPKIPRILPKPRRIEILMFPRVQLLDVAGPMQVFATANELADQLAPYDVRVVAMRAGPIASSSGLVLLAEALPLPRRPIDTLIVAGGWGVDEAINDRHLIRWIGQRARTARRTASVCSGALLLAEADCSIANGAPRIGIAAPNCRGAIHRCASSTILSSSATATPGRPPV